MDPRCLCVLPTETLVDDPLDMYPQQKELREAKLVQVREHVRCMQVGMCACMAVSAPSCRRRKSTACLC